MKIEYFICDAVGHKMSGQVNAIYNIGLINGTNDELFVNFDICPKCHKLIENELFNIFDQFLGVEKNDTVYALVTKVGNESVEFMYEVKNLKTLANIFGFEDKI